MTIGTPHTLSLNTLEDAYRLGLGLAAKLQAGDVITFSGQVGAGKTTLVRSLLQGLGFMGDVPSPSYALVIPYDAPDVRVPLWHLDLYRLKNADELDELGLDEAVQDHALLVEWPEHLLESSAYWRARALQLHIEITDDGTRCLTAHVPQAWEARWLF